MSESAEIWYFLRGEESVGPFSANMLKQIHEGGQMTPETLVWRDGMSAWTPAKEIPELEISDAPPKPAPPPPPPSAVSPPAPVVPSPLSTHNRLKLKGKDVIPVKSQPASAYEVPPPIALTPLKEKAVPPIRKLPEKIETHNEAHLPPKEQSSVRLKDPVGPTRFQRFQARFLSSAFITPLFLFVAGLLTWKFQSHIPNFYWFRWLILGYGVYGLMGMAGIVGLDSLARPLSFAFLIPPLVLIWPVIMRDATAASISEGYWVFVVFAVLFFLTTKIGLKLYMSNFLAGFSVITGLLTLALLVVLGSPIWEPVGWNKLMQERESPSLPPKLAMWLGKPEWGSGNGWIQFVEKKDDAPSHHPIDECYLKTLTSNESRIVITTTDEYYFTSIIHWSEGAFSPEKILNTPYPVYFSKDAINDPNALIPQWRFTDGTQMEITQASMTITGVQPDGWRGTFYFLLKNNPDPIQGTFFARNLSAETK